MPLSEKDKPGAGKATTGPVHVKKVNVGDFILWGPQTYDTGNPDPNQMDPHVWQVTLADKTGDTVDLELLLTDDGVTTDAATVDQELTVVRVPFVDPVFTAWTNVAVLTADATSGPP